MCTFYLSRLCFIQVVITRSLSASGAAGAESGRVVLLRSLPFFVSLGARRVTWRLDALFLAWLCCVVCELQGLTEYWYCLGDGGVTHRTQPVGSWRLNLNLCVACVTEQSASAVYGARPHYHSVTVCQDYVCRVGSECCHTVTDEVRVTKKNFLLLKVLVPRAIRPGGLEKKGHEELRQYLNLICFVFIGSPTETAVNHSRF